MSRVLVVDRLTRRYGKNAAVDGISFTAEPGMITGLLGHNGCGKSTTLRMLAGAMKASSGSFTFNGITGGVDSLAVKYLTGYVPDIGGVFPRLSGWEHMQLASRLFRLGPEAQWAPRAKDLLEKLEIADAAPALAGTYSHGMSRKLSTAIALLSDPRFLLVDEPFDGVDAAGVATISDLLIGRAEAGATVVLSTHLLNVAEQLCGRTVHMTKGRLD
jgi:ABC-2 type transport system ATP-binding protein